MAANSLPKVSNEPREWEIYTLSDPRDGVVWYVGATYQRKTRFLSHLREARSGRGSRKCNWLRTLLALNLEPTFTVIESGQGDWQAAERRWIAHYRDQNHFLTNGTDGGEGPPVGFKMPPIKPETRAKMAAAQRGKKHPRSTEYRRKLSERQKGKPKKPEAIEKMAAFFRGRKQPPELVAKRAASLKATRALRPLTDEQRAAMAKVWIGRKHKEESKAKMSAAKRGTKLGPRPEEVKAKIRATQTGTKRGPASAESKAKRSAALKGKPWSEARRTAYERQAAK